MADLFPRSVFRLVTEQILDATSDAEGIRHPARINFRGQHDLPADLIRLRLVFLGKARLENQIVARDWRDPADPVASRVEIAVDRTRPELRRGASRARQRKRRQEKDETREAT